MQWGADQTMSPFARLGKQFAVNWTTILVGWKGLGYSRRGLRLAEFPPLLSADELAAYANECLASSSDVAEDDLVVSLLFRSAYRKPGDHHRALGAAV